MQIINASTARKTLFKIMDCVAKTHGRVTITGQNREPVVLISDQDLRDMEETIYLYSIPGMVESIIAGGKTPLSECVEWDPKNVENYARKEGAKRRRAAVSRRVAPKGK